MPRIFNHKGIAIKDFDIEGDKIKVIYKNNISKYLDNNYDTIIDNHGRKKRLEEFKKEIIKTENILIIKYHGKII